VPAATRRIRRRGQSAGVPRLDVLSPDLADWEQKKKDYAAERPGMYYGRHGTPTLDALEEAITELEGGYRTLLFPSGSQPARGGTLLREGG